MPRPDPAPDNGYTFEFPVRQHHADGTATEGRMDLYKRACFVLESKQFKPVEPAATELQIAVEAASGAKKKKSSAPVRGSGAYDDAMVRARHQAENYARNLPAAEPNPPFLVVVDVGDCFELFADFTQAGKSYLHFPDPGSYRIRLGDLRREDIRERLRLIWTDPVALDPARRSADVTCEVSDLLAKLAKSFEEAGHAPRVVADFLCRCLFSMFAEDVGLLPDRHTRGFSDLLKSVESDPAQFAPLASQLFKEMAAGTGSAISLVLRKKLLRFNGGLFEDATALPVNALQLRTLAQAAAQDWKSVEPAIFGTLLMRALDPGERHKLGAEFTPRAYVERLVLAAVIEPLREEWQHVRAAAVTHALAGRREQAIAEVRAFHRRLCALRVLDPACGSGNFLYVAFELLKRLEAEVLDELARLGDRELNLEIEQFAVGPHQFLGIELNPRAAAIAELVLWIGYLQWHFRTRGQTLPDEPVLKKFRNIECRDAVLAYDGEPQPARDEAGNVITVWDRRSMKKDAVTGRDVPDETKRVPLLTYTNPRPAVWPETDFIIGNPPFIGNKRMRDALGEGYSETLREACFAVPESADFVMYWWHKAAELARYGKVKRFGLITTNSLRQTFNRRVVEAQLSAKPPLSLVFAIADHPWVDTTDGAAVRIAMTVGMAGSQTGDLLEVVSEQPRDDGSSEVSFLTTHGRITPDITTGAEVGSTVELRANSGLSNQGVTPLGTGFRLSPEEASEHIKKNPAARSILKPYVIGRDLVQEFEPKFIIDFYGVDEEQARTNYPTLFQHVLTLVKPERDAKSEHTTDTIDYAARWWQFAKQRTELRLAIAPLERYIATCRTAKHRIFVFLSGDTIPDAKVVAIALHDAYFLGVLSGRIHAVWAIGTGSFLEDRPNYNHSECFAKFPFPACEEVAKERIRRVAEELDAHRKRQQAQHPGLTLTGIYNVLEKLRAAESSSVAAVSDRRNVGQASCLSIDNDSTG
ncbi:MAG: class I SAM-dependent DNA methyltransferase, partial [Verrucomicrobia bacterium]|nr:class I SAM-dependent DNA methyltransferase [Verrucomicrobiota bacterium]